ncbi:MAG: MFS transporter [Leptospirillum sp.]
MKSEEMNPVEKKALMGLSLIYATRMLGLFIVLPVLSLYAKKLPGADPVWLGLALGGYGLTQGVLQVPFGALSDRIGRKKVIVIGLLIFAAGSVIAAMAQSIGVLLLGRLLQGSGAVASVITALMADLTREEVRTRAMAGIGMSIGLAFAAGMIIGPVVSAHYDVSVLFWMTAVLSLLAIVILYVIVPNPPAHMRNPIGISVRDLGKVLSDGSLVRLDFSVFILHASLTAVFVAFPILLSRFIPEKNLWHVYLPVILAGLFLMVPGMIYAEKKKKLKKMFLFSISLIVLSFLVFLEGYHSKAGLITGLTIFFIGFNLLEPIMPSIMTRFAKTKTRGTSSGVFSMSQFLGAFAGGLSGGILVSLSEKTLFGGLLLLSIVWFFVGRGLTDPNHLEIFEENVGMQPAGITPLLNRLGEMKGIVDCRYFEGTGVLWVKYLNSTMTREEVAGHIESARHTTTGATA